jgi:AAA15 family ATPase/GTPase
MNGGRLWSLDLDEFRGIRKIEMGPIKLAKFNVLIGRNNSGKTSLLEAIALLPQPNLKMSLTDGNRLDVIKSCHEGQSDSLVYGYSGSATITYTVGGDSSKLCLRSNGEFHFETRNEKDRSDVGTISVSDGIYSLSNATKSLGEINAGYYADDFYESMQRNLMAEANWNIVTKSRAHNRVLKEVISPSVTEKFTEVLPPHFLLSSQRWTLEARKEFPDGTSGFVRLSELGRGLQRVIVPLLVFEATNPSIALWDDIEAGMHPSLLDNVLKWLLKKEWQTVMSTHSIDVLSTVAKLEPKDSQIIILRKSPDDVLGYQIMDMQSFNSMMIDSNQDPRLAADALALR